MDNFYDSDSSNDDEDTDNNASATRGRCRKIRPLEEFFIVLWGLRRGISERHSQFVWCG